MTLVADTLSRAAVVAAFQSLWDEQWDWWTDTLASFGGDPVALFDRLGDHGDADDDPSVNYAYGQLHAIRSVAMDIGVWSQVRRKVG